MQMDSRGRYGPRRSNPPRIRRRRRRTRTVPHPVQRASFSADYKPGSPLKRLLAKGAADRLGGHAEGSPTCIWTHNKQSQSRGKSCKLDGSLLVAVWRSGRLVRTTEDRWLRVTFCLILLQLHLDDKVQVDSLESFAATLGPVTHPSFRHLTACMTLGGS
ncbi:uncharacterized protein LOC109516427 isoform X2 [Hippocampus comes]|uniref:uncharacterized protein LOC109516427 isoform X2 n=1 Tax=Hippocampus comes TaxID=109280 RepID=UPI00094E3938|nr:PREDICTED: uncharacterized protein LOC109516427 isoform X2 [Hippocampus comes]